MAPTSNYIQKIANISAAGFGITAGPSEKLPAPDRWARGFAILCLCQDCIHNGPVKVEYNSLNYHD